LYVEGNPINLLDPLGFMALDFEITDQTVHIPPQPEYFRFRVQRDEYPYETVDTKNYSNVIQGPNCTGHEIVGFLIKWHELPGFNQAKFCFIWDYIDIWWNFDPYDPWPLYEVWGESSIEIYSRCGLSPNQYTETYLYGDCGHTHSQFYHALLNSEDGQWYGGGAANCYHYVLIKAAVRHSVHFTFRFKGLKNPTAQLPNGAPCW